MQNQTKPDRLLRRPAIALSAVCMAVLAGCANYAGMHSDRQMIEPDGLATTQSLPAEQGRWPAAGWDDQFGDAQLKTLIDEALQGSPSLEMARARVAAAAAATHEATDKTSLENPRIMAKTPETNISPIKMPSNKVINLLNSSLSLR